jgi:hypothetical protein
MPMSFGLLLALATSLTVLALWLERSPPTTGLLLLASLPVLVVLALPTPVASALYGRFVAAARAVVATPSPPTLECRDGALDGLPPPTANLTLIIPPSNCWTAWYRLAPHTWLIDVADDPGLIVQYKFKDGSIKEAVGDPPFNERVSFEIPTAVRFRNPTGSQMTFRVKIT